MAAPTLAVTPINSPITFESTSCNGISLVEGGLTVSDILTLTVSDGMLSLSQTTGLILSPAGVSSGSTIAITAGTTEDINAALNGMTYTSPNPGRNTFTMEVSGGQSVVKTFPITVNDMVDVEAARDELLDSVTEIHSGVQPGRLVTFEESAFNVLMYPGDADSEGPMVGAGTMGSGRIVAMPDHQMIAMGSYGGVSGPFYKNAISWITQTTNLDVSIVTYDSGVNTWLTDEGYTNVQTVNEASLASALATADIFVGWMGSSESATNIETLRDFCVGGGGLFVSDYGKSHSNGR